MFGDDSYSCDCPTTTLIICKGDDMDFSRSQKICMKVVSSVPLDGLSLHFHFYDYCKKVDVIPPSGEIEIAFTAEDTNSFPAGKSFGEVWLEDENGKRRTVTTRIIVDVTLSPTIAYDPVVVVF